MTFHKEQHHSNRNQTVEFSHAYHHTKFEKIMDHQLPANITGVFYRTTHVRLSPFNIHWSISIYYGLQQLAGSHSKLNFIQTDCETKTNQKVTKFLLPWTTMTLNESQGHWNFHLTVVFNGVYHHAKFEGPLWKCQNASQSCSLLSKRAGYSPLNTDWPRWNKYWIQ